MKWKERVLLAASILFGAGLMEGALRLWGHPPSHLALEGTGPARSVQVARAPEGNWRGGLYYSTPSGRRLHPNVDGIIRRHYLNGKDIRIRTNSHGLRGPEPHLDRRPRILFLGDSVTLGDALDESDTFVERIRAHSQEKWETLNAGVGSVGIDTELAILREKGPRLRPEWVVLNLYLNDVDTSPAVRLYEVPRFFQRSWLAQYLFQAASLARHLILVEGPMLVDRSTWDRWRRDVERDFPAGSGDWRTDRRAFHQLIHGNFRDWGSAWHPEAQLRLLERIDEIRRECEKLGARLRVVIHPVRYQVESTYLANEPQRALLGGLSARGIPALDLLEPLRRARGERSGDFFYDHCHHNPLGARVVGEIMYAFLQSEAAG